MKRFSKWLNDCTRDQLRRIKNTVNVVVPYFIEEGFTCVDREFIGFLPQVNSVSLEKVLDTEVLFATLLFDKNRSGRFCLMFGSRLPMEPFDWIRAGDLVRFQSEKNTAKWWGPTALSLSKDRAHDRSLREIQSLLPPVIEFIYYGKQNENIFARPLTSKNTDETT